VTRTCETCGLTYNDEYRYTQCPHVPLGAGPAPWHPTLNPGGYCKEHDFFACKVPVHRGDKEMVQEAGAKAALKALYTFPGVRELLAPSGSLGSIRDTVERALDRPDAPGANKTDRELRQAAVDFLVRAFEEDHTDVTVAAIHVVSLPVPPAAGQDAAPLPLREDLFVQGLHVTPRGELPSVTDAQEKWKQDEFEADAQREKEKAKVMAGEGKDPNFYRGLRGIIDGGEQGHRGTTAGIPPAKDGALAFLQFAKWNPGPMFRAQLALAAHEIASYHKPTEDQTQRHLLLTLALEQYLVYLIQACPPGPERSTAISWARASKMFAAAAISLEPQPQRGVTGTDRG